MNYDFNRSRTTQHQQQRSAAPDPYEVLNLTRDADLNTIRNKFRTLTRLHHPDRNRRNPNYDPTHYAAICAAYETLTDPKKRAQFDQSAASHFNVLRDASRSNQVAPPQQKIADLTPSARMSDGDLRRFNEAFEKQRQADANDRGYGVQSRITEQEAKSGNRSIEAPVNIFGGTKVGEAEFNSRFQSELQQKRRQRAQAIQERGDGEPEGWFQGTVLGASDISLYDGVIVNQERDDFSGAAGNAGASGAALHYADYMAGFETFTEQLPEDHHYYNASGDIKKQYNEKLSQLSSVPERGHNMSFQQAQQALASQREREMQAERERNKHIVLKYRDQYSSQDLLPSNSGPNKRDPANQQSLNQALGDRAFSRF
jgi:curved DNA-binding protein CbpA